MILYEHEGKKLLSKSGIKIPSSQLVSSADDEVKIKPPLLLKAQTLSGQRAKAGGIAAVGKGGDVRGALKKILGKRVNGERVEKVLVEEKIDHDEEFYLSISYDSDERMPVLAFSKGGSAVEAEKPRVLISPLRIPRPSMGEDEAGKKEAVFLKEETPSFHGRRGFIPIGPIDLLMSGALLKKIPKEIKKVIPSLVKTFFENDGTLLEINPLVISESGKVYALDAKIKLDDSASPRHPEWDYPPRAVGGHKPSKREIQAKKIDEGDYRGTAGSTYFDLDGDIAVLASGGGASLTAMDALLHAGGTPANYTEYSGNPPKEKVNKLAKIVLSKKGLSGLWIVGAVANFTDIYETLSGFLEAIRGVSPKPKYPIVIRRGGPRDKEAFEMLKKVREFDFHLYGAEISITASAKIMAALAKKYAASTKKR